MGRNPTWHCPSANPKGMCARCRRKFLAMRRREARERKKDADYRESLREYNRLYMREYRARKAL